MAKTKAQLDREINEALSSRIEQPGIAIVYFDKEQNSWAVGFYDRPVGAASGKTTATTRAQAIEIADRYNHARGKDTPPISPQSERTYQRAKARGRIS